MDMELLARTMRHVLAGSSSKGRVTRIQTVLDKVRHSHRVNSRTLERFLARQTARPGPETLAAYEVFLRETDSAAYFALRGPNQDDENRDLQIALTSFFKIPQARQSELPELLHPRYTIIRDAWMSGVGRKSNVNVSQLTIDIRPGGVLSVKERQQWQDADHGEAPRTEDEDGIVLAWHPHFAFVMRSQQHAGLILHVIDDIETSEHKVIRASGVSQPIVSSKAQIPTAFVLLLRPPESLGGIGVHDRRQFFGRNADVRFLFEEAERAHYLGSGDQGSLAL